MLIQIFGGKQVEVDEKTAEILVKAGKAEIIEEVKEQKEVPAQKKTRKKVNDD